MKIVHLPANIQVILNEVRNSGKTIGLVPTMGALHEGHLSLVRKSVNDNDFTVVSVFVNPTQFNNPDDLAKYPRNLDKDSELLKSIGCDLIFAPNKEDIYSEDELKETFSFDFGGLDEVMEGAFRPGHFNGVVQIVSKLFELVQPHKSYFGEKDYQQLAIIHRMTKLMNFDIEIVDCPIIREKSGLAMSSRNERLTFEQRKIAASISKVLFECRNFVPKLSPFEIKEKVVSEINKIQALQLEYFEVANAETLQPAVDWNQPTVAFIAVCCGDVRLIDNIRCS